MNPRALKPGERCGVRRGIYAYKTKEGRIHYGISYTVSGVARKEIIGPTIRGAEQALAVRKAEIAQGRLKIEPARRYPRFSEFILHYIDYARANKKSWEHDRYLLTRPQTVLGNKHLNEISPFHVEQYKSWARSRVGVRTVNMELALLRRMFNLAIAWGFARENPLREVRNLREVERPMRVLSDREEEKLLAALPAHLRDAVLFALHTGMRRGEIFGLTWARVNFSEGFVTVGETKTGKVRHVPLNAISRGVLERQPKTKDPHVFTYHKRPYVYPNNKTWSRAVKASGIDPIRFHDLRHTFATRLSLQGVDIRRIQKLLGHASIRMTEKYQHPAPEDLRAAVERLADETKPAQNPHVRRKRVSPEKG